MNTPPYDWARLQQVKGMARSVSQTSQYLEDLGGCRYRYFLSRVVRAWDRPAAWLAQGIAVHTAAEWWEKTGRTASLETTLRVYRREYRDQTARLMESTPNTWFWSASGRYEGPEDIERRAKIGEEQVARYYDYYVNQKPDEVIWVTPKGEPAIELGFSTYFGDVQVRGLIDQIIDEIMRMRDIKTGAKPGDMFQLATYRYAMMDEYGVDFDRGDFWMGKSGRAVPAKGMDLTLMSRDQVTDLYARMDAGVKAEDFTPSPSAERCGRCPVATACMYAQ